MSTLSDTATIFEVPEQQRALLWCVLASVALHALVLLGASRREAPAPPSRALLVLTATLALPAAAPPAALRPPQPEVASPPPAEPTPTPSPTPTPRPVLAKPAATAAPSAQRTMPAEPAKAVEPAPAVASAAPSSGQPAGPVEAKPAATAPAGMPGTEAVAKPGAEADAGTLEQYRLALIVSTRRYKRYPAIAMEKGWQGRVVVSLVIGANGMTASATIKSSSGHEILDNQALDMIKKGKTTVPIPAGLRGREFSMDVPVIFSLDNPNS
jgi:protein TonB